MDVRAPASAGSPATATRGHGGPPPIGIGGAGAGGQGRDHRNQYYIPEDEPFVVQYDCAIAPAVLGVDRDRTELH